MSISRLEDKPRYLIAKKKETDNHDVYYIAFHADLLDCTATDHKTDQLEQISSMKEIASLIDSFPLGYISELLRAKGKANRVILTGFSVGGTLACTLLVRVWTALSSSAESRRLEHDMACITFGQPHIMVDGLAQRPDKYKIAKTIHSVLLYEDKCPRVLGILDSQQEAGGVRRINKAFKQLLNKDTESKEYQSLKEQIKSQVKSQEPSKLVPCVNQAMTYYLFQSGPKCEIIDGDRLHGHQSYPLEGVLENFNEAEMKTYSMVVNVYVCDKSTLMRDGKPAGEPRVFTIPSNRKPPAELIRVGGGPQIEEILLHKYGSEEAGYELVLVVKGENLWFFKELRLKEVEDKELTIPSDIIVERKEYMVSRRQKRFGKLSPSQVIEVSFLSALLEKKSPETICQSDKINAIQKFSDEVIEVVPLESLGYAIAFGQNDFVKQHCAMVLATVEYSELCKTHPSKMMIDALIQAKNRCERCQTDPNTGQGKRKSESDVQCSELCKTIDGPLKAIQKQQKTVIMSDLEVKYFFLNEDECSCLTSPIKTLTKGRKVLTDLSMQVPAGTKIGEKMLKEVNNIRNRELAICVSLLGAFMDHQQISIPLDKSKPGGFSKLSSSASIGVWALSNLSLEDVDSIPENTQLMVNVTNYQFSEKPQKDQNADDEDYAAKLCFMMQGSSEKTVTYNSDYVSYSLEKQLSLKWKQSLARKNVEEIAQDWNQTFGEGVTIARVAESHRPMIARWLKWSLMVHDLREELAKYTTIGVIGMVNSGKSTLVKKLFPHLSIVSGTATNERTTLPFIYNVNDHVKGLNIMDFPGVDDMDESISDTANLLLTLSQIVVFVVDYRKVLTGPTKKWLDRLESEDVPLLVCLTFADALFVQFKYSEANRLNNQPDYRKIKECLSYDLQDKRDKLKNKKARTYTCDINYYYFELSPDSNLRKDKSEQKKMAEAGILSIPQVEQWLVKTLEESLLEREIASELRRYLADRPSSHAVKLQ